MRKHPGTSKSRMPGGARSGEWSEWNVVSTRWEWGSLAGTAAAQARLQEGAGVTAF